MQLLMLKNPELWFLFLNIRYTQLPWQVNEIISTENFRENWFHGKNYYFFFLSSEYNMHQIGYYLDEDKNWSLDMDVLEKAYQDATEVCNPRYFGLIFLLNFIQFYSIVPIFFVSEPLSLSILEIQLEMFCPEPTLKPLSNLLLKRNYLYLPMKYIKTMFMLMDVNSTLSKR